VADIIEDGVVT